MNLFCVGISHHTASVETRERYAGGAAEQELLGSGVGDVLQMLKGKPQSFECKVEGNKWYHTGKLSTGLTVEEVWERVEKK